DSDLSVWLSVDPLSDKYPSTSPYMYVLGNPLKLIDSNGMSAEGPDEWDVCLMQDGSVETTWKSYKGGSNTQIVNLSYENDNGDHIASGEGAVVDVEKGRFEKIANYVGEHGGDTYRDRLEEILNSDGFFDGGIWTVGLSGNAAFANLGVNGEVGFVIDARDGFSIGTYTSYGRSTGLDLSGGILVNYYKPISNPEKFSAKDLDGYGVSEDIGFFIFDISNGGDASTPGLNPLTPSPYHTTYTRQGFGVSIGLPLGATYNRSKMNTSKMYKVW
ncbi:MAG: hypothetical protein JXR53_01665, partial [Bacteroidales bacterium]|nr:hypothetical protein [Bacteroidales bacterium]